MSNQHPTKGRGIRSRRRFDDVPVEALLAESPDPFDRLSGEPMERRPAPTRWLRCPRCDIRFAYSAHIDAHLREKHAAELPGRQPFSRSGSHACPNCGSAYTTADELSMHERAHHPRRMFI